MSPVQLEGVPAHEGLSVQTSDLTESKGENTVSETISADTRTTFEIALDGVPTAGYVWELVHPLDKAGVVQELGHEWKRSTSLVGGPSQEHFRFLALTEGEVTLHFRYRRPWEKDFKKERIFHVRVGKG